MKVIVIGAGGITRDLLRGLGEIWEVTVVDSDTARLADATLLRHITTVEGDGSSRVVLREAGIESADALVAATNDDSVNLEAARIATEANVLRVVAVAADPERLPDYRDLDVEALSPDRLTARRIEISLEPRRLTSAPFAAGTAEAIEFRIADDSVVRGRALRDLHSESWLVAAILREGQLIIPHGETVLHAGDLVTVVGAAADYASIVRTFTSGEATFPTNFGKQVAVALQTEADLAGPVAEAITATRHSAAEGLLIVHEEPTSEEESARLEHLLRRVGDMAEGIELAARPVKGSPTTFLRQNETREGIGLVVVPAPEGPIRRLRVTRLLRWATALGLPLLVSRGSFPYERVVVPSRDTPAGRAAARAGIELTAHMRSTLLAVSVVPPPFVTGSDAQGPAAHALGLVREQAAVHGVSAEGRMEEGNPVREIVDLLEDHDLLVLGMPERAPTFLTPGTVGHLMARARVSVLLVPAKD